MPRGNRKPITETHPEIAAEWDYERNGVLSPEQVTKSSPCNVHWKCSHGHEWEATISSRTRSGKGCPYCEHRIAAPGEYSLKTEFPSLLDEWDWEKNKNEGLDPDHILPSSSKKAHWICFQGHEWVSVIASRTNRGNGCPHCAHRIATPGKYSLLTEYPEMASEWDYKKNPVDISPDTILPSDKHKYWWKCNNGHSFETSPYNRTSKSSYPEYIKCPYCEHRVASPGEYSLKVLHPELMDEWDWEKNLKEELDPDCLLPFSSKKAHWKCVEGHEWQAVIYSRTSGKSGCPYCSHKIVLPGVYSLLTEYPELSQEWDYDKNPPELDPDNILPSDTHKYWWKCSNGHSFEESPCNRVRRHIAPDYYECPHCSHKTATPGEYSFATEYPELLADWDYNKNKEIGLDPDELLPGSSKIAYWKCHDCAQEWETSINTRVIGGKCPKCSGKVAIPGEYSFVTEHPDLLEEWDWDKNAIDGIDPDEIHPRSRTNVHWKCSQGHEWTESVFERVSKADGSKCPECYSRRQLNLIPGVNDLATLHPELAMEWSDKNECLPSEVRDGTNKKYWWQCSICGHEWQTRVNHRTRDGHGCPACAGISSGPLNNLSYLYPEIAAEWCYEKNDEIFDGKGPSDFAPHSAVEAYWQCPNDPDHNYKSRIGHRVEGYACPYCSHHQIIPGNNSFAVEYPELLKEWDYDKNDVNPDEIAPGSSLIVWWKCNECGREWKASVADRSLKGHGCQECKQGIGTSFAEQVCYLGMKMIFPELKIINRYHTEFKREIDIYVPELGIGLEPGHWELHKGRLDRDEEKILLCAEAGIRIYTIFEKFPEGECLPFEKDCFGYSTSARYNKGHLNIRDIIKEILCDYLNDIPEEKWSDSAWNEIAHQAHLKLAKLS